VYVQKKSCSTSCGGSCVCGCSAVAVAVAVKPLLAGFREGTVAVVTEDRILAVKRDSPIDDIGGGWKMFARLWWRARGELLINRQTDPGICSCENWA
jgi:hypothetical protein